MRARPPGIVGGGGEAVDDFVPGASTGYEDLMRTLDDAVLVGARTQPTVKSRDSCSTFSIEPMPRAISNLRRLRFSTAPQQACQRAFRNTGCLEVRVYGID